MRRHLSNDQVSWHCIVVPKAVHNREIFRLWMIQSPVFVEAGSGKTDPRTVRNGKKIKDKGLLPV